MPFVNSGASVALLWLAFLLLWCAVTGRAGATLGAAICPGQMVDTQATATGS